MKIRIEIDEDIKETEMIIKCKEITKEIQKVQQSISQLTVIPKLIFYKGETEYYLPLDTILFFETAENNINAHTDQEIYHIKYRLYELEEILPNQFIRISKSTILNVNQVYSIEKNLTSSSSIQFYNSHKQVYVSRNYYKNFKQRLEERRNYER